MTQSKNCPVAAAPAAARLTPLRGHLYLNSHVDDGIDDWPRTGSEIL
jgi:hypothetical protein